MGVYNGGVALMASWRCAHFTDVFHTDDVIREYFGKAWTSKNSRDSVDLNPESASYNSEWLYNDAYTKLHGNVKNIHKYAEHRYMLGALWNVADGECVFHDGSLHMMLCAVASGRVGRGQVCVYAGSECSHVLATVARIPPAVFWSDVRPFIFALSHSGDSRRAVPIFTSG